MVRASEVVKAPAKAAKERQRGISVLDRLREQERIEAEKEAAQRPRKVRSQSQPPKDAKRKRELFEKTAAEQFNFTGEFHVRSLVNSIAEKFKSGCCAAFVTPMAPRVLAGNTINLPFQCTECGEAWDVQTGAKVRINLFCDGDEDSEDEDEQPRLNSRGRKIAKRKQTNSRNETNVRAVIAALLSGQTYTEYKASQLARDERYMYGSMFDEILSKIAPAIVKLQDELVELVRYLVVRYGNIGALMLTHDFFWLTRGHNSRCGSGTICDLDSGAVLAYRHYCIGKDKLGDFGGFEYTPAAMDPISCGEMLDEVVNWMESKEGVDKITELYMEEIQEHAPDGPKLAGAVLDGDASTNALVPVVMQKAAAAGETRYCKEFKLMKCTNHLGKNTGKHAASIGHSLHKTCSCPANMTQKGEINKTQPNTMYAVPGQKRQQALRKILPWKPVANLTLVETLV